MNSKNATDQGGGTYLIHSSQCFVSLWGLVHEAMKFYKCLASPLSTRLRGGIAILLLFVVVCRFHCCAQLLLVSLVLGCWCFCFVVVFFYLWWNHKINDDLIVCLFRCSLIVCMIIMIHKKTRNTKKIQEIPCSLVRNVECSS